MGEHEHCWHGLGVVVGDTSGCHCGLARQNAFTDNPSHADGHGQFVTVRLRETPKRRKWFGLF